MLRFREWFSQINAEGCPPGSRAEMTAGNIPPVFNAEWVRMSH
jgi:hypothetical protein